MVVTKYSDEDRILWDDFVGRSKNGTFLFLRSYMEYHQNRFKDSSLIVRNEKGKVVAILPANINHQEHVLSSHDGLTYGGLIIGKDMGTAMMLEVFDCIVDYLRSLGVSSLMYKTIPHIYHQYPAEEDRYALFLMGATLYRRDVLSVIKSGGRLPYQERRKRQIRKSVKNNLSPTESDRFDAFWIILEENLTRRYGVKPVHTVEEIIYLNNLFPDNIKLYICSKGREMVAGVVVFESERVAHIQYISASDRGKDIGALDLLFFYLIEEVYADKPFFDFGISNEKNGQYLNVGLINQKEGFGARAVVHDYYRLEI